MLNFVHSIYSTIFTFVINNTINQLIINQNVFQIMRKNRKNRVEAPVVVEQNFVETVETAIVPEPETQNTAPEEELPFEELPTPTPEAEPEQTEEQKNGYRVVRVDQIQNLKVGEMYKREDKKNCKVWTVVLKDESKMLVSSSPKNTHNPRKEADMEVVVIEML